MHNPVSLFSLVHSSIQYSQRNRQGAGGSYCPRPPLLLRGADSRHARRRFTTRRKRGEGGKEFDSHIQTRSAVYAVNLPFLFGKLFLTIC